MNTPDETENKSGETSFRCFACRLKFVDIDSLTRHEQNEHPNEYHAAMVREMYGYQDGYDDL